jgi:hypothetical protein
MSPLQRRGFLKAAAAAAAGVPLVGRFVVDAPTVLAGPTEITDGGLIVPKAEPLVLSTDQPAQPVGYMDAWLRSFEVDYLHDYVALLNGGRDHIVHEVTFRLEGTLVDASHGGWEAVHAVFTAERPRPTRLYFEPV